MRRETVHSEYTQAEKRRVLRDTLHTRAVAEANMIGGRWATESQTRVVGSGVEYPQLPPDSPWRDDPVPVEPPLGINVDEMVPVGEAFEVERSLRESSAGMNDPSLGSPTSGELRALMPAPPPTLSSRARRSLNDRARGSVDHGWKSSHLAAHRSLASAAS